MNYKSTRGAAQAIPSSQAIKQGISSDGGLFMPEIIPAQTLEWFKELSDKSYIDRAVEVLGLFLADFTHDELYSAAQKAYGGEKFGGHAAPVVKSGYMNILELWHGPTSAFKDMALQIMPHLMSLSLQKTGENKKALILVATSGDTGKAALDGYAEAENIYIQVFYPENGVSPVQKKQMTTQKGSNVSVFAVKGNFDDAQTGVKKIFADPEMTEKLQKKGLFLSSANSINWGRLVPQIVYYISAYADMANSGQISFGQKINVTVPTGNFGNILACFIAKKMGLPIGKMICASNSNNVLTDFFETGIYDRRRDFHTTISPSMDILISSNLERLLYLASGADKCAGFMKELADTGFYRVDSGTLQSIKADFEAFWCSEEDTKAQIADSFSVNGYLCDPHTAVGIFCANKYIEKTGDNTPMLAVSTASPYKFSSSVLSALGEQAVSDEFASIKLLEDRTGTTAPAALSELKNLGERFTDSVEKDRMCEAVIDFAKNMSKH